MCLAEFGIATERMDQATREKKRKTESGIALREVQDAISLERLIFNVNLESLKIARDCRAQAIEILFSPDNRQFIGGQPAGWRAQLEFEAARAVHATLRRTGECLFAIFSTGPIRPLQSSPLVEREWVDHFVAELAEFGAFLLKNNYELAVDKGGPSGEGFKWVQD